MGEPSEMILPIVREMRAELAAWHDDTLQRLDKLNQRLQALTDEQVCLTEALVARDEPLQLRYRHLGWPLLDVERRS